MTVEEPSGIRRNAWPVTSGIPFAKGRVENPREVSVFRTDGQEAPLQTEVLATWPDGSVRWLLLDFQVDLDAGEKKSFSVRHGPGTSRATVREPIRVTDGDRRVVIDTGPMRLQLSKHEFRLLDAAWLDTDGNGEFSDHERVTGSEGAGIVLTTRDGNSFRADAARAKLTVEQAGPLRACVRIEGKHGSSVGHMLRYVVRIHAYRGQPTLKIYYTFINDWQKQVMARIDSLNLGFSLAEKRDTGHLLDGNSATAKLLFQVEDNRYQLDGKPAGERAAGWAALGGSKAGLAVGVREFWQNWPKSISHSPGKLTLGICPQFPNGLYDGHAFEETAKLYYYLRNGDYTFKIGSARTHEVWATFFAGAPDAAKLSRFFRAAEDPLLATCDPAHVDATKVYGDLPPADRSNPKKFGGYDSLVNCGMEAGQRLRERDREYGMLNFGDLYRERKVNWRNLESGVTHAFFLQYLRSGDRRFYLRAEQAARHHIDVDVIHAVNPHVGGGAAVGGIWTHSLGHTGGYFPGDGAYEKGVVGVSHTFGSGDIDYYYLTGDRRARKVTTQMADKLARQCPIGYSVSLRSMAWPMVFLLDAYRATGDKKYLDAVTKCWGVLKENIDWEKGWVHQFDVHCHHPAGQPRCKGCVPGFQTVLLNALSRYHRMTGDPEVLRAISVGFEQMIRETWDEDAAVFRRTSCPHYPREGGLLPSLFIRGAEGMAYEVALTSDKEHLRILRKGFTNAIPKSKEAQEESFKIEFPTTLMGIIMVYGPHGLTALED